uniref:Uncharacterized protein n=1 Tax=candidate division WOR-3 bacterium TaxID=2052148 RepID=A0A7C3J6X8_UNCW3
MTEQNYRIRIKLGEAEIEAEGDKEFVEKHIEEFKKEMPKIAKELPPKEKIITPEIPKEKVELEKLSLAEFYRQKQPKDHNETVVVFAYWLTKKEGKEEFTPKDIENCYTQTGVRKPRNVPQTMKILASGDKAYLIKGEKRGIYKISMLGKDLIEKELTIKSEE